MTVSVAEVMLMHNRSHAKTYNFDRVYWPLGMRRNTILRVW